eukprot:3707888-Amphidinium_carterae.1
MWIIARHPLSLDGNTAASYYWGRVRNTRSVTKAKTLYDTVSGIKSLQILVTLYRVIMRTI